MELSVIPDVALARGQNKLQTLRRGAGEDPEKLRAAAQEFESIMLGFMVKEMRKNVPESPIFGQDRGREIFNEMLDNQYVRIMTERGGIGLTAMLMRQLSGR